MRAAEARHARDRRALVQGALIIAAVILLCVGLSSCGGEPEVRPPAVAAASLRAAAAEAAVAAAEAEAEADAAPAAPEAASLQAAARKLAAKAKALDERAEQAEALVREQEQRAEVAAWRRTCRWIGVLSLLAGAAVVGIGLWRQVAGLPTLGMLVAGCGAVVQAWGEALGVLAWLLPMLLLAGAAAQVVRALIGKDRAIALRDEVAVESAHLIDAAERGWDNLGRVTSEVKATLRAAQERAGNHRLVQIARGKLKDA